MSKLTTLLVQVFQIAWLSDLNYGRDKSGNDNEQERNDHSSMLRLGWWETAPVVVCKLTAARLATAMERLAEKWAALKGSQVDTTFTVDGKTVVLTPSEMLRAFEEAWVRKGKLIEPEYDGVFAFQRGNALLGALALRLKEGLKGDYVVPVIVKEFENEYERASVCIMENTGKMAGAKLIDTHWPSLVRAATALRDTCKESGKAFKEIDCIRVISGGAEKAKRGTGQKAYYLATLDARFPALGIASLIQTAEASTEEQLRGQELGKAVDRNMLQKLEIGTRVPLPEKAEPKSEEDVAAYFANPRDDDQKAPVITKRSDAYSHANNTSILVVKYIIEAIYTGELAKLNKLEKVADELNAAFVKSGIQFQPKKDEPKK